MVWARTLAWSSSGTKVRIMSAKTLGHPGGKIGGVRCLGFIDVLLHDVVDIAVQAIRHEITRVVAGGFSLDGDLERKNQPRRRDSSVGTRFSRLASSRQTHLPSLQAALPHELRYAFGDHDGRHVGIGADDLRHH